MASDPIRTLLLPFENGEVAASRADRALFLRAQPHLALLQRGGAIDWRASLACVQSFKPTYDSLAAQGFAVTPEAPVGGSFDFVLVRLTRHKLESLGLIAEGLGALKAGGTLGVAGAKDEGIESVEKRVKALLGPVASLSKHHARSFLLTRQASPLPDEVSAWADALKPAGHIEGFVTAPGMFSFDRADRGSRLLATHLPGDIRGSVADFGAGWGYLSAALMRSGAAVSRLDLYEAEAGALACARLNLAAHAGSSEIGFHWADVTSAAMPARRYDAIIMNPPFHNGGSQQVSLGQAFIAAAARALRPGGRLLMVANLMLPYERVIAATFKSMRVLASESGFKAIEAKL